jgi:autotransporter-associated beta strand protein
MRFNKQWRSVALTTAAAAAVLAVTSPRAARAGLAINWLGDDYTGNGTWNSNTTTGSLAIAGATGGSNVPAAVTNAFGTHTGVDFSSGGAFFNVPAGTFPINANPANFTVALAFKANGVATTTGGNFFQGQMVFGNDSPGGGTPDWCFTWGGQNNQSLFGSIGFQGTTGGGGGGDSAFQTGSIDLSAVHAAVMVVDATNNQQRYYLDGRLIGQRTGIVINPRDNPNLYRIGGGYFNGSFNGRIAELRVYDDTAQNGALLSSQLANAYGGTYGVQALYTWTDTTGAFSTGTNWDVGTAPNDILYHQTLINNGGTAQISGAGSFNVSDLWVGSGSSGVGHVTQTGGTLNVGQTMILAQGGTTSAATGDFDMSGGTLNVRALTVAGGGGTLNTATMTVRGNAVVNVSGGVAVSTGNVGSGTFNLQDTAQFNTGTSEFWVGNGGSFSTATMGMSGGSLNVNNWLAVGRDRASGVLNLSGGTINKTGNGNITIGALGNATFNSNGTVNQTGGQIVSLRDPNNVNAPGLVGGEIYLGESADGKGTWNFSAGSASAPIVSVGYGGQGSLNLSGTAQITADAVGVARAGTFGGVANLNGGSITTAQIFRGGSTGPGQVNFNGTNIVATADNDRFIAGFSASELALQGGGAVINTNGHNVGVDSGFSGTGPLIKNGAGVLTINAAANNTLSGNTVINAGTLKLEHVTANNNILAKNVSAYYQFNDSSNLGKDSSPNANDVIDVFGTATITTATAPPNHTASLSFPDNFVTNHDFLSTADGNVPAGFPTGNSSYTIAAWINVDNTNTNRNNGIVGWGDIGATPNLQRSSITFRTQANGTTPDGLRNSWFIVDNAANLPAGTTFVNTWHHVVATYDSNTDIRRIFVDGNLLVSDFQAGLNNAGTQNFGIGRATLMEYFSGNMADLLVARSALTQAQIQQLIANGMTFGSFNGPSGALSPNSVVQIAAGATLDLNGANSPSGGLGNVGGSGGIVTSSTAGNAVLTLSPVGSTSFSGVIQNGAGTVGITKSGAGTQILSGANTYTGTTTVNSTGGALILLGSGAWNPVLSGAGGADVQRGRLVFDYSGGSSPAPTVKSILTAGFPGNFATGQIRSSTATSSKGLGWGDNTTAHQVTVMYTYFGDANLDGAVDTLDFNSLAANFGGTGKVWTQADFNYDGTVDTLDFNKLAANFGQTNPEAGGGGGSSSVGALVPEPATLALAGFAASGLLFRPRRRRVNKRS